jgi:transposase-like protein
MGQLPKSFEVYGYTIEVQAGGRRVWPPSFKRYVTQQLEEGGLAIGDVLRECSVSQSLVYKWRAEVKRAGRGRVSVREERLFSEVVIDDEHSTTVPEPDETHIKLRVREVEILLPATYAVDDLVNVALSLEARA